MLYIYLVILFLIIIFILFYKSVENFNPGYVIDIPYLRPDKIPSADSCNNCSGVCLHGNEGKFIVSSECSDAVVKNSISSLKLILPRILNTYITLAPTNKSEYYLDFLSSGLEKDSSVFVYQPSTGLPKDWTLEPVHSDPSSVYIRTNTAPYYYLFGNKDGSVGVSLFRGNVNQYWMIVAPIIGSVFNIINKKYCSQLTYTNKPNILGDTFTVELTTNNSKNNLWNINIQ